MPDFKPFADLMAAEGLPQIVIDTFQHYYDQLASGHSGIVREDQLRPKA